MITTVGLQVAEKAKAILRDATEIMAVARTGRSPMTGEMRLGVIPTISPFLLPRVLPVLRKRFPALAIYLREEQTAPLLARLEDGELDVGLVALPYDTEDLSVEIVGEDEFLFAGHRSHPLAGAAAISREALAGAVRGQQPAYAGANGRRGHRRHPRSKLAIDAGITRGTDISLSPLAMPASRQIGLAWRRTSLRTEDYRLLANTLREVIPRRSS